MDRPTHIPRTSASRRFILLPEAIADASSPRPRVRRYRLTSVGGLADRRRAPRAGVQHEPPRD